MASDLDLIVGAVLMDNIVYADGSRRENIPGGAGLYALAGAALFSDGATLVTGTGRDLEDTFGPWLGRNGLSREGLRFADDFAPRNILTYQDERTRTEVPVYGAEHFARIEPTPSDIARLIGKARSIYIFRNADPRFWEPVLDLLRGSDAMVLWEVALDACQPDQRTQVMAIASEVDALSINREEAALLLGSDSDDTLITTLMQEGAGQLFLRVGSRGSYAADRDGVHFLPSLKLEPVDVTGGGNAYSGGALIGLATGHDVVRAAAMATAAASLAIGQYGPPDAGTESIRARAQHLTQDILSSLEHAA